MGASASRAVQSSMATLSMARALAANQRWRARNSLRLRRPRPARSSTSWAGLEGATFDAIGRELRRRRLQPEPVVAVRGQADEVETLAHRREAHLAQHLVRRVAGPLVQVELDGLGGAGEVVDREDGLPLVLPHMGQHALVGGAEEPERAGPCAGARGGRRAELRLDIDGLIAVD